MTCLAEPVGAWNRTAPTGHACPSPGRAGRPGQNPGQRLPKGRTKRLTFTEGRLRLHSLECTTRPESQAFRQAVRRADGFGLDFSLPFYQEKGRGRVPVRRRWRVKPAMTALGCGGKFATLSMIQQTMNSIVHSDNAFTSFERINLKSEMKILA